MGCRMGARGELGEEAVSAWSKDASFIYLREVELTYEQFTPFIQAPSVSIRVLICLQCGRPEFNPWAGKEGKATHSSILAWRIPQTEEPGRL